ncbi:WD repeat domain phosphoinositide-interacting protein 1 isoform X2 [Rhinichthys klamathensis goyatoka]|uniref:WD repeat domain phosphoinositide-interacting protein 1 isoform X2 n=1 Tax=Rhinichthys klamathensis goyatoka TaxID=3034132 RepID=UPI0024B6245E|nr:WD repeat domain phosphoinositide-interacting protein 1 isoform X2 [Rhinichthys klamathensis goyatoka]
MDLRISRDSPALSSTRTRRERAYKSCRDPSLAVGCKNGYRLFSLSSVDRMDCIHQGEESPDVCVAERLFSSSLMVIVSRSTPFRMNIIHFKKGTEICNYSYSSHILAVKLNRQRLVVCLEEALYIHNIKDMKLLKSVLNTPPNPKGLCALSVNHSNSYLAYPGSFTAGEITLYDAGNLTEVTVIPAHASHVAAVAFSASGTSLASASEKGTVIRVFSIPDGDKLFEFRRGMKRYVSISSLSFSADAQFLCASSNTETVHIFRLEHHSPSTESPSWSGYMGKVFSAASSFLPSQVSDMMHQDRAFASVHLSAPGMKNISALSMIQKVPRLLVASLDGHLYIYNLDLQDGGDCRLVQKHRLYESADENPAASALEAGGLSYAETVSTNTNQPSSSLTGYSEDGGVKRGELIPDHEFADESLRLDDEQEFPPVSFQDT